MKPMKPTCEPVVILEPELVARVVGLIRRDATLGAGSCSSWDEVAPSEFEASERVRALVEEGVVAVPARPTPRAVLEALRAFEADFFGRNAA